MGINVLFIVLFLLPQKVGHFYGCKNKFLIFPSRWNSVFVVSVVSVTMAHTLSGDFSWIVIDKKADVMKEECTERKSFKVSKMCFFYVFQFFFHISFYICNTFLWHESWTFNLLWITMEMTHEIHVNMIGASVFSLFFSLRPWRG